nr:PREDICTED: protein phosphatase 1 regulatory subunit 12B-like isoform X6 [Lepisosteus oculatus]
MAITVYMLCDCAKQNKKHPFQHIFRPYLTPVRDEEAESQRKARSRQARQTRRSTQGVTLAELKEAQKMFGLCRSERQIEEADGDSLEKEEADTRRDPKASPSQSKEPEEPSWRWTVGPEFGYNRSKLGSQPESPSKPPSTRGCFYFPSSTSPNHISSRGLCRNTEKNGHEWKNEGEREFDTVSDFILSLRDRRQARDHGRGTDTSFWTHESLRAQQNPWQPSRISSQRWNGVQLSRQRETLGGACVFLLEQCHPFTHGQRNCPEPESHSRTPHHLHPPLLPRVSDMIGYPG